jgi:hypothetical protein
VDIKTALQTALNSLVTAYQTACVAPKPNYSIDGQSVSWGEYLKMLSEGIKETAALLGTFDPVEAQSIIL